MEPSPALRGSSGTRQGVLSTQDRPCGEPAEDVPVKKEPFLFCMLALNDCCR